HQPARPQTAPAESHRSAGARRAFRLREVLSVGVIRRHAPACGDLPCVAQRPCAALDGRAVRRARRDDARADELGSAADLDPEPKDRSVHHPQYLGSGVSVGPRHRDDAAAGAHRGGSAHRSASATQTGGPRGHSVRDVCRKNPRDVPVVRAAQGGLSMSTSASTGEIGTLVLPRTGAPKSAAYRYSCLRATPGEIGTLVLPRTGARKSAVYLYPCIATIVLFIVWEIATRYGNISPLILPPPTEIFATAVAKFPVLARMSLVTSYEFVLGFILAAVVGLPLGALIVYARPVEMTLYPMLVAFQTIPKAAIAPVFIVWLGTGITSKILIAFAISFFPIVIDTIIGLRSTQPETIY